MPETILMLKTKGSGSYHFLELPCENTDITDELGSDWTSTYEICDYATDRILQDNVKLDYIFRVNTVCKRLSELTETESEIVRLLMKHKPPSLESYENALRTHFYYELLDFSDVEQVGKFILEDVIHTDIHNGLLRHSIDVHAIGKQAFLTGLAIPVEDNKTLLKTVEIE